MYCSIFDKVFEGKKPSKKELLDRFGDKKAKPFTKEDDKKSDDKKRDGKGKTSEGILEGSRDVVKLIKGRHPNYHMLHKGSIVNLSDLNLKGEYIYVGIDSKGNYVFVPQTSLSSKVELISPKKFPDNRFMGNSL